MIPLKYYIYIYCRYIKISFEYKLKSIGKWLSKPRYERYKYFNPENEKYALGGTLMSVLSIATDNIDKIYCKDINRQMFYTSERTKIIINALKSIFSEPFGKFQVTKKSKYSIEDLSVNISYTSKKITMWFFSSLPLILIIVILCNLDCMIMEPQIMSPVTPPKDADANLCLSIIFVITMFVVAIYVLLGILVFALYNFILFLCLWRFMSKNCNIVIKTPFY